jgi:hypothetical protein
MAQLKITKVNGDESVHQITPSIEYAFEAYAKKGFAKAFAEDQKQSDIFWLAWKCLSKIEDVPLFGEKFVEVLAKVEVLDDAAPNS